MAKPPPDADPEKFIIGHGVYSNLQIARPYHDDCVFRIDPTPMPVLSIVIYNLVFIGFFYGFHWALKHLTHGEAGRWAVYGAPIGIGLMTCGLFTVVVYRSFANARRSGPWFIYDKVVGRVELPREGGVRFDRHEVVHLQYITTKRLDWGGVVNNERLSELNLITCRDGTRKRWPLLRSIFTVKAFDRILKPLVENTDLPVVRVQDEWLGWRVTEMPYGRTASNQLSAAAKRLGG
jgi:hypothetical protein